MSTVLVVTPLVVAAWPVLSAAITAAVGTMGFAAAQNQGARTRQFGRGDSMTRAEIEVEDSEILAGTSGSGEEMVVESDGVRATFSRDARGALKLCVEGHDRSKVELERIGEALVGKVTQQYVYHRVVSELKDRDMIILDENVGEDQAIHIRVRNG